MHSLSRALVLLVVFYASIFAFARQETSAGRIVAYDKPLACLNGNVYRSIIIRVENPKKVGSQFIRVDFSHPCDETPKWFKAKSQPQKFHLIRDKESDEVLKEFFDCVDESSTNHLAKPCPWQIWEYVPGAELVSLPFGQRIPCYRSVNLPLAPVV
jgi:hypothetical protein